MLNWQQAKVRVLLTFCLEVVVVKKLAVKGLQQGLLLLLLLLPGGG